MGINKCKSIKVSEIWEKMGNPVPFQRVMDPSDTTRKIMGTCNHSPKNETRILGPE